MSTQNKRRNTATATVTDVTAYTIKYKFTQIEAKIISDNQFDAGDIR